MKFGAVKTAAARGAVLAHSAPTKSGVIKKGRVLQADDLARLLAAGFENVVVAQLEAGDIGEDEAAGRIAAAIAGPNIRIAAAFTGRANLLAAAPGLATIDAEALVALNRLDESLTVATVKPWDRLAAWQMIATVKIITFAVPAALLLRAEVLLAGRPPVVALAAFERRRVGLVLTTLPGTKPSVVAKRARAVGDRVEALGGRIGETRTVAHKAGAVGAAIAALAQAGLDPILVFGASAIVDRGDVIPAAVVAAGGTVEHLGMPVDPGNLAMLAHVGTAQVLGVPSCASSPKLNGFDWLLERHAAGRRATRDDIIAMAPGGLLMEIETRPQPRTGEPAVVAIAAPRIAAIVLAAGRSTRMGGANKLLEELGGVPILRRVVQEVGRSKAQALVVVTGHERARVEAAVAGLDVELVHNPRYADGISTSIGAGIGALDPAAVEGALVVLGDMPEVSAADVDRLITAFAPMEGRGICVPVRGGRRGNPVLWGGRHFAGLTQLDGDIGARHLIAANAEDVHEVEIGSDGIFADVDTPDLLSAVRKRLRDG